MLSDVADTIGSNIRRLRIAAGFKEQGKFAAELGIPQSRLSDLENDRYEFPETSTLLLVAKALRLSIDHLLHGKDLEYDEISGLAPKARERHRQVVEAMELLAEEAKEERIKAGTNTAEREERDRRFLDSIRTGDLIRHGTDPKQTVADSQPQREVKHGPSVVGAAPSRVQPVDPTILSALENVALLVGQAIAEAKGKPVPGKNARVGKSQSRVRKRAGGSR